MSDTSDTFAFGTDPNGQSARANCISQAVADQYTAVKSIGPGQLCLSWLGTRNPCMTSPTACNGGPDDLGWYYCDYKRNVRYTGRPGVSLRQYES